MSIVGTFCVFHWPFTELGRARVRPALILSEPDALGDVDVAMVTSSMARPDSLPIAPSDYEGEALPRESHVRTDRILKVRLAITRRLAVRVRPAFVLAVRKAIIRLDTRKYARQAHVANRPGGDPVRVSAGLSSEVVPYAGRVFTEDEVEAAASATLDFWLTLGPEGDAFETELAGFLGVKRSTLVNSGSSANLLAISALTSHKLPADKRIRPGDEVITCAAGFPTTVAPIIQCGAIPVLIDADPVTLNARPDQLEEAYVEGKTKAVIMAHTLGNPFDLASVTDFCRRHNLWLIEDNCDALGSTYDGQLTGTFGDLSTQSFYPPHHITMGEGGAVNTVRDMKFKVLVESFRDWGRDCWCASGKDNTCKKRFGWQLGELPEGYDHKYIYSHLGYNLKPLDIQAAIGRAQLKRLPAFIEARRSNWQRLRRGLDHLEDFFEFHLPTHATGWTPEGFVWDQSGHRTDPSWFGFLLLVRQGARLSASEFARYLDGRKIGNRALFGGNLVRQPAFVELAGQNPAAFRTIGELPGADRIMRSAVFLGAYPGLTGAMLDYVVESVHDFVRRAR